MHPFFSVKFRGDPKAHLTRDSKAPIRSLCSGWSVAYVIDLERRFNHDGPALIQVCDACMALARNMQR